MLRDKHLRNSDGFSLVEILLIAPIVILVVTAFIAVIVTITGQVLQSKELTGSIYASQAALGQIEDDARVATQFLASSYATNSPQGIVTGNYDSASGAAISTTSSPAKLIIRTLTTTQNPSLNTRDIVYKSLDNCATTTTTPYAADVVYFLKTNADNTQSLWRRVVFGTTATAGTGCPTPWQLPSCSPGYTNTTICKADDAKLVDDVTSMTVTYYLSNGTSSGTTSSSVVAAKITLATSTSVAGKITANTSELFVKRGNAPLP